MCRGHKFILFPAHNSIARHEGGKGVALDLAGCVGSMDDVVYGTGLGPNLILLPDFYMQDGVEGGC